MISDTTTFGRLLDLDLHETRLIQACIEEDEAESDHDDFNQRSIATENSLRLARENRRAKVRAYLDALSETY